MSGIQPVATRTVERGRDGAGIPDSCPACGQRDALIALGVRYDHPYRWRPWITRATPLALCDCCDVLLQVVEPRRPAPSRDGRGVRDLLWPAVAGSVARV